jgi:tetratricopeptide (TPR) repeat protein
MAAAHFALARAYSRTGNLERAVASLKDAISRDADFIPSYLALAEYYQQRQDGQTALAYANEVLKRNPDLLLGHIAHANAQLILGELQQALAEFTTLANAQPKNPALQERLGYVELRQKDFSQAEQRFEQALEEQANFLPAMRDLLELYGTQKRPDKAVTRLQEQIEKAPEQAAFYELLGNAYLLKNELDAAERAYRAAIDHNKNAYVAHTQLARIYAQKKKLPEAISEAQLAVQQRPDILLNYVLLGTLYENSGAIEPARTTYEQALQRDPNFALALNNLAWLHCQHGGSLDVALGLAQRAKQNLPNNPDISDTLAWIEYRKGLYSVAAELLRDSLRQAPDSSLFQYHLGMVLLKQGKDAEAKPILSRAVTSELSAADAEQTRTALRQLEAHRM